MKIKLSETNEFEEMLYENLKDRREVIIVNIGTDKVIGDSVAPLLGTLLNEQNLYWKVYGTLENPIHALNIDKKLVEINNMHPNAFIIAIDACLSSNDNIGEIHLRDCPINPGKGVGKELPSVGDLSIVGIVDTSEFSGIFSSRVIRLHMIYEMANKIKNELLKVHNKLINEIEDIAIGM